MQLTQVTKENDVQDIDGMDRYLYVSFLEGGVVS
jgi:hypothetical protein